MQELSHEKNEGLVWLAAHEKWIRRMCRRTCRSRPDLAEDCFSECIDRAPRVAATYDAGRGTKLTTHMYGNLKWYAWKWLKRTARTSPPEGVERTCRDDRRSIELGEEVQLALSSLSDYDALLLRMRYLGEMTHESMSEMLGVPRSTVARDTAVALERARAGARP